MKDIKFRLYNKHDKKMYLFDPRWGNYYHGDGWVGAIPFEDEKVTYAPSNRIQLEPESCEWMQYVGLKDKNDKEIYEGDIVNLLPEGYIKIPAEVQITTRGIIFFRHDTRAGIYGADWCEFNAELSNAPIIGNIYENPELLKEVQG